MIYDGKVTLQVTIPIYGIDATSPEEAELEMEELAAESLAESVADSEDIEVLDRELWESEEL